MLQVFDVHVYAIALLVTQSNFNINFSKEINSVLYNNRLNYTRCSLHVILLISTH